MFDDTEEDKALATEKNKEVADAKVKELKKKIIGNVEFIGELIIQKVLSTKVVYLCGGTLIKHFFDQHNTTPPNHVNAVLAEIFIEAVIKIIEKVGEKFETNSPPGQANEIMESIHKAVAERQSEFKDYDYTKLTAAEFFDILRILDAKLLKTEYLRVSALLANLEERRNNGWKLHLATEVGPKTLNEIKKDVEEGEDRQVEEKKVNKKNASSSFDVEKGLQDIFVKVDKGSYMNEDVSETPIEYKEDHLKEDIKKLLKKDSTQEVYNAYLRLVSDCKKDFIIRRLDMFKLVLESDFFKYEEFRKAYEAVLSVITHLIVETV